MKNITFLGPIGATFSHDAYDILAEIYDAPKVNAVNCQPAVSNGEILRLIQQHDGYGAIAIETLAEGRVAEPLESFIELLKTYSSMSECNFRVVGAIRLKLHFCLMVQPGISESEISRIVAHPKALGACKGRIANKALQTTDASSNGEAARLVAESDEYLSAAALGPKSASGKYGLKVLDEAFEDGEAVTTFFLIAPASHHVSVGKENRVLIVFKVPHSPGALVRSLLPFEQEGLNLIQIHSVHAGNHTYNFAIEIEIKENELESLNRAMVGFKAFVDSYLCFGPFEVLSR